MSFLDLDPIHWMFVLWPVPLLGLAVALYAVKRKTGLQGWRRMVPGNIHAGINWIARGVSMAIGLVCHKVLKKVPWKPILIWGPWVVIILVVGFYTVENWRGARALERVRAEWRTRGEKLRVAEFLPPPIPYHQNFAESRAVAIVSGPTTPYRGGGPLGMYLDGFALDDTKIWNGNPALGIPEDVGLWLLDAGNSEGKEAARRGLEFIGIEQSLIDEFDEALRRPGYVYSYPKDVTGARYDRISDDCLVFSSVFTGRAVLYLRLAEGAQAMGNLDSLCLFAGKMRADPTLHGAKMEAGVVDKISRPVWEGLRARAWTEEQLEHLDERFAEFDLPKRGLSALKCEIAGIAALYEEWAEHREILIEYVDMLYWSPWGRKSGWRADSAELARHGLMIAMPVGWLEQRMADTMERFDRAIGRPGLLVADELKYPMAGDFARELESMEGGMMGGVQSSLLSQMPQVIRLLISKQGEVDLMRVAVALERHRLRTGHYPADLGELVPREMQDLPVDLVTGEPLQYRIKIDGTPLVYGVGFNEVDDGGVPARGPGFLDWVWQYTGTPGQSEKHWIHGRAPKAP